MAHIPDTQRTNGFYTAVNSVVLLPRMAQADVLLQYNPWTFRIKLKFISVREKY